MPHSPPHTTPNVTLSSQCHPEATPSVTLSSQCHPEATPSVTLRPQPKGLEGWGILNGLHSVQNDMVGLAQPLSSSLNS